MKISYILLALFLFAVGFLVLSFMIPMLAGGDVIDIIAFIFYIPTMLFVGVGPIVISILFVIDQIKKRKE